MNEKQTAQSDESESDQGDVWRYVKASRASVIVDAEDYFRLMQDAMLEARKRILMIGWDFDTRIHLQDGRRWWQKGRSRKYPSRLGSFILWLVRHRDDLEVRILKWSVGTVKFVTRGSMSVDLLRWFPRKQIDFKFDTAHPVGCSHHQKIVVLDDKVAVCGGIDMTTHRWDTRDHKEEDTRRRRPRGFAYGPWHDATMMVEGEAAKALSELGRTRWTNAGGEALDAVDEAPREIWPKDLPAQFENVEIGIARTQAEYDGRPQITEIADLFARQISEAKDFIYAESQYFASRRVADALCERLSRDDPPEVVIVHPESAEGWLEAQAMDNARAALVNALEEVDHKHRFQLYVPYTGETPIYVHAKIMIVDDKILRIGSANLNNRSLGLDSECDLFIDANRKGNEHAAPQIARLRYSLLAEHCGLEEEEVPQLLSRYGGMQAMIKAVGTKNSRSLRKFSAPVLTDMQDSLASSKLLDPEHPDEMFEPFANDGLFPRGRRLSKARDTFRRRIRG